jgi:hypothetical protein
VRPRASRDLRLPVRAYTIGLDGHLGDADGSWAQLYGVAPVGAVMVPARQVCGLAVGGRRHVSTS